MLDRLLSILPPKIQLPLYILAVVGAVSIWFFREEVESIRLGIRGHARPALEAARSASIYDAIIPTLTGSLLLIVIFVTAGFLGKRKKANVQLAREWRRFIDTEFNADPSNPVEIEAWWHRFLNWRDQIVVPLVTVAHSEDRAITLSRLVVVDMRQWREDRSQRFNHVKSMMNQTLQMLREIIDEFKQ